MKRTRYLLRYVLVLVNSGLLFALLKKTWSNLFGEVVYLDLKLEVENLQTNHVRPLDGNVLRECEQRDIRLFREVLAERSLPVIERFEAARRVATWKNGIRTCYVVEDSIGNVRFMQWLITSSENDKLHAYYGDWYPTLSLGDALMEWVYVFPKYRGTGILPKATELMVDRAIGLGIRNIYAMIQRQNANSLVSFRKLGFRPYRVRIERRVFARRRSSTISVSPSEDIRSLDEVLALAVRNSSEQTG